MTLKSAIWMSANAAQIEYEDRVKSISRKGWGIKIVQDSKTFNWFHFPISTPIILDGQRLAIEKVFVLYQPSIARGIEGQATASDYPLSMLKHVHLYDGTKRVVRWDNLNKFRVTDGLKKLNEDTTFIPDQPVTMYRAPSISVCIEFGPPLQQTDKPFDCSVEFSNVGIDCVVT